MRTVLSVCAVVALLCLVMASPAPAMDGNEILKKVDEVQSASKDSVGNVTMTLVDKGGQTKERTM
ncbi:MAG TPA: hypothetical protein PL013_11765, partial [Deltaproteobacteria bacterium]|nr:hypothetical protein [Deltaproteobacteria bacterium]